MAKETVTVMFQIHNRKQTVDIEVPLNITANELVVGLNAAYDLGIDTTNAKNCYLTAENPIALLKGNRLLSEYGLRNGTIIHFVESRGKNNVK